MIRNGLRDGINKIEYINIYLEQLIYLHRLGCIYMSEVLEFCNCKYNYTRTPTIMYYKYSLSVLRTYIYREVLYIET